MNRVKHISFALFFFICLSTFLFSQEKYTLKNQIVQGNYLLRQDSSVSLVMSVGETNAVSQTKTQFFWDVAVKPASEAGMDIELKATRILYQYAPNADPSRRVNYDSDFSLNADPNIDYVYQSFIGQPIKLHLNAENVVEKIEGLDEIWKKIEDSGNEDYQKTGEAIRYSMPNSSFADIFNQMNYPIPQAPVAVNDTWETKILVDVPGFGKQEGAWSNTLQSIEEENGRKYFNIASNSTLNIEENDADVTNQMTFRYELETGMNVKFSTNTRVVLELDIDNEGNQQRAKSTALIRSNQVLIRK